MSTTDIATVNKGTYLALNHSTQEISEILQDNLAGQDIGEFDLPRIKIPAGGATTWEVPGLSGIESTRELQGIVVAFKRTRAYWPDEADTGTPPVCRSADAILGVGTPGGDCRSCPLAQYGSHENGRGQACAEKEVWFILRPSSFLPVVLSLPGTSLKNAKNYRLALASEAKRLAAVTTTVSLEALKNPAGDPYSRAVPTLGEVLDDETAAATRAYADLLRPVFDRAAAAEAAGTSTPAASTED